MINIKISNEEFYDSFHRTTRIQKKIITPTNFTYIKSIEIIEECLKNLISIKNSKLKILDYGSGAGTLSYYLASKGYDVTGVDISKRAVKISNLNSKYLGISNNVNFISVSQFENSFKGKKYNIILLLEIIEHIHNDKLLIKKMLSLLKSGGYLIISTPTNTAPLFKLGLTKRFDKSVGHLRRYDKNQLEIGIKNMKDVDHVDRKVVEGLLRNSLFVFEHLSFLIKFIRGPVSRLVTLVDDLTVRLFGESNIYFVIKKK